MSALRLCFVLALGHCLLAAVVGCSTVQRFTPREESKGRAAQLQELQLKVMRRTRRHRLYRILYIGRQPANLRRRINHDHDEIVEVLAAHHVG